MPKNITPEEFMKLTPEDRMIVAMSEYFRTEREKHSQPNMKRGSIFRSREVIETIAKELAVHHLAEHTKGQDRKKKNAEDNEIKKKIKKVFGGKDLPYCLDDMLPNLETFY